jgi:hypothetical protein
VAKKRKTTKIIQPVHQVGKQVSSHNKAVGALRTLLNNKVAGTSSNKAVGALRTLLNNKAAGINSNKVVGVLKIPLNNKAAGALRIPLKHRVAGINSNKVVGALKILLNLKLLGTNNHSKPLGVLRIPLNLNKVVGVLRTLRHNKLLGTNNHSKPLGVLKVLPNLKLVGVLPLKLLHRTLGHSNSNLNKPLGALRIPRHNRLAGTSNSNKVAGVLKVLPNLKLAGVLPLKPLHRTLGHNSSNLNKPLGALRIPLNHKVLEQVALVKTGHRLPSNLQPKMLGVLRLSQERLRLQAGANRHSNRALGVMPLTIVPIAIEPCSGLVAVRKTCQWAVQ